MSAPRVVLTNTELDVTKSFPARSVPGWLRRGWEIPSKRSKRTPVAADPAGETVPTGTDTNPQQEDES